MSDWELKTSDGTTYQVVAGTLTIPYCGLWVADLFLRDEAAPGVGQGVTLTVRGTARTGAVVRSGAPTKRATARVVGGAGKMGTVLDPRDYRQHTLDQIVADCLRDAGETPGDLAQASAPLAHWSRAQERASLCLSRLWRLYAGPWRVARDGSICAPVDSWATVGAGDTLAHQPTEDVATFAPESGELEPGKSVLVFDDLRRIDRATYALSGAEFRVACHLLIP